MKSDNMNPLSDQVAKKFCELCNWAYEVWCTHRKLFDDNTFQEQTIGKSTYFTNRLSIITQEYCLQQIVKLHDRAIMRDSINLTIDFIKRFGEWDDDEKEKVASICDRLNVLFNKIKTARNKVIAHNDLETLIQGETLGDFPENLDRQYFQALQELADIVHSKWIGGPYPFNDLAEADVEEFLALMKKA